MAIVLSLSTKRRNLAIKCFADENTSSLVRRSVMPPPPKKERKIAKCNGYAFNVVKVAIGSLFHCKEKKDPGFAVALTTLSLFNSRIYFLINRSFQKVSLVNEDTILWKLLFSMRFIKK